MPQQYDVVIVGSGINGLTSAAKLSGAKKRVALLERAENIGGFIDSGELISPGFTHDTFSSWHPLFMLSAAYADFGEELHKFGLQYCNTDDTVTASVAKDVDGEIRTAICYRDAERTALNLEHAQDQDAYLAMLGDLNAWSPAIFGALGAELKPWNLAKILRDGLKSSKISGMMQLLHQAMMSGRNYTRRTFAGWEVDQLWTPWLLHAGLGPDATTGGIMLPVMAGSMHQAGLPIVQGGAKNFVSAFKRLLEARGVEIFTNTDIAAIDLVKDTAVAAKTSTGKIFEASDGIFASVGAQALYNDLLPHVPALSEARSEAKQFQAGRGAIQIHLTLSAPVPWLVDELKNTPLIHVTDGSNNTAIACAQAEAGYLPARPTIVVGQQSLLDSSRAPDGAATLWLQLQEAPYRPIADSADEIPVDGQWTNDVKKMYLERVLKILEEYAPGLSDTVQGSEFISPPDLEAINPNAIHGDPYGGSAEIYQNLLWRPLSKDSGWSNPVKNLYHIGAAVHPGPGLGAGSGFMAAEKLLNNNSGPFEKLKLWQK